MLCLRPARETMGEAMFVVDYRGRFCVMAREPRGHSPRPGTLPHMLMPRILKTGFDDEGISALYRISDDDE